ncbi:glutaredoxin family protein [Acidobacteria bacterium AB60]|nr:glutaredoxin family protein [Acidobacteria bacterium AB60]
MIDKWDAGFERKVGFSFLSDKSFEGTMRCGIKQSPIPRTRMGPMHDVIVYSRKGCHLCDIVKETLAQALADHHGFQWREIDIDADPELCRRFNEEVPVVFIDGRKAFKYRMDRRRFLKALEGRDLAIVTANGGSTLKPDT